MKSSRPQRGDLLTLREGFFFVRPRIGLDADPFVNVRSDFTQSETSRSAIVSRAVSVGPYTFVKLILDGKPLYLGSDELFTCRDFSDHFTWDPKGKFPLSCKVKVGSILQVDQDPRIDVRLFQTSGNISLVWNHGFDRRFRKQDLPEMEVVHVSVPSGDLRSGNLRARLGHETYTMPVTSLQFVSLKELK